MDYIYIRDLQVRCVIGVYEVERANRQDVFINIRLGGDFRAAAASDDIADAIDYKTLKQRLLAHVEQSAYRLIESMAERLAAICLEHPKVQEVQDAIDKPGALRFARSVAVEVTRRKAG